MTLDLLITLIMVGIAVWAIARRFAGHRQPDASVVIGGALARGMKRAQAKRVR